MIRFRLVLLSCAAALCPPGFAAAQENPSDEEKQAQLGRVSQTTEDLLSPLGSWDDQYGLFVDVIHNVWSSNDWNSEPDMYAKRIALEVARIPPWDINGRLGKVTDLARERYHLDDGQSQRVRELLDQQILKMSVKYFPTMFAQAREIMSIRVQGKPFAAEDIARWTRQTDPLVGEIKNDTDTLIADFGRLLNQEQQETLKQDIESFQKRFDRYLQSRDQWRQGHWTPADWGLQNDPIHRQAMLELALSSASPDVKPADEDSWVRYCRAFIELYQLDQAQQAACQTILEDLRDQARQYRLLYRSQLDALQSFERENHPLTAPLVSLFEQLKARLALIPTEIQRARAAEQAGIIRLPASSENP